MGSRIPHVTVPHNVGGRVESYRAMKTGGGCILSLNHPCRRYHVGRVDRLFANYDSIMEEKITACCVGFRPLPRYSSYRHVGVRRNGRGKRSAAPGSVLDCMQTG